MKRIIPLASVLLIWTVAVFGDAIPGTVALNDGLRYNFLAGPDEPEREVELYPNPVTEGQLTVNARQSIQSIQVLNITGKIVFNEEYQPNTTSVVIDLNELEKGIYLVRISFSNKELHTEKIMVK
jgi:hypothetical protein